MRRSPSGWAALVVATLYLAPQSHADSGADFSARQADELQIRGRPLSAWLRQLRSGDLGPRVAAADALGDAGPAARDALPALANIAATGDRPLTDAARQALLRIDPGARLSLEAFRRELKSPDWPIRQFSLWHLGSIADAQPDAVQTALLEALHDECRLVRASAAMWLGRPGPNAAAAAPALICALGDESSTVRKEVAQALGNIGADAQSAAAPLARALADPDELVRTRAYGALLKMGRGRSDLAPVLLANLKHPDRDVRFITALFLARTKWGARNAVAVLCEAMLHGDQHWYHHSRSCAAATLGGMGPDATEAVPALLAALADSDDTVHEAAAAALRRVDPVTAGQVLPPP